MNPLLTKVVEMVFVPFVKGASAKAGSKFIESLFEDEQPAERPTGEALRPRSLEPQDSTGREPRTLDPEALRSRLEQRERDPYLSREERERPVTFERQALRPRSLEPQDSTSRTPRAFDLEEARRLRLEQREQRARPLSRAECERPVTFERQALRSRSFETQDSTGREPRTLDPEVRRLRLEQSERSLSREESKKPLPPKAPLNLVPLLQLLLTIGLCIAAPLVMIAVFAPSQPGVNPARLR